MKKYWVIIFICCNSLLSTAQSTSTSNTVVSDNLDIGWANINNNKNLQLNAAFQYLPPVYYKADSLGKYSFTQSLIGVSAPVYLKLKDSIKHIISLTANAAYNLPLTDILYLRHNVFNLASTINYTVNKNVKYILISSFGLSIGEDQETIKEYLLRYDAYINYLRISNEAFKWQLGMAYQKGYGTYNWVPIVAVHFVAWPKSNITIGFPINTTVRQKINNKFELLASIRKAGNSFRIYTLNEPFLNISNASVHLRQTQINCTVGFNYKPSESFNLKLELGSAIIRNMFIGERKSAFKNNIHKYKINPGPIYQISLSYNIPLSGKNKISKGALLHYIDINDIDVDDAVN